jgi:hypothetical protein
MDDGREVLAVTDAPVPLETGVPVLDAAAPTYVVAAVDPPVVPLEDPLWAQWWFWAALVAPVLLLVAAIALAQREDAPAQAISTTATTISTTATTIAVPVAGTLPVPTVANTTIAVAPATSPVSPAAPPVVAPTAAPTPPPAAAPTPTAPPTPAPTVSAPAPAAAPTPTSPPVTSAPPAAATTLPPPPATTFADGDHAVGTAIAVGRYRAPGSANCSWTRRTTQQVVGSWTGRGPAVIDILGTDAAVAASGCGTFSMLPAAPTTPPPPAASLGEGTWIVGTDIAPGSWSTAGGPSCTWTRVRDFLGTPESVVEQGTATSAATVALDASVAGFVTQGCTWTPS